MTQHRYLILTPLAFTALLDASVARAGEQEARSDIVPRTDHLRLGAIAGVGFPRPLAIEAMAVIERYVAIGAEYAVLPSMSVSGATVSLWSLAGDLRVFPFRGAFFVGLRAGRQHIDDQTTLTMPGVGSLTENLALDGWFVNPRLGFLFTARNGLTLGIEAGLQVPIGAQVSSSLPLSLDPSAERTVNTIGNSLLPTVDLLRVGLLL